MPSASRRARSVEQSFPVTWSQDSSWYQEGPWHGGQVLRLITATILLMARLTKQLVKILLGVNL